MPSSGGDATLIAPIAGVSRPHFTSASERIHAFERGAGLISMKWDGTDRKEHVQVRGSTSGGGEGPGTPASLILMAPDGDQALAQVGNQLYVVTLPRGIGCQLPLLRGGAPVGMDYGAYAIGSGLAGELTQAMSAIVFGGASQFIGVQLIASGVPGVMIVLATLLVNLRHLLYSASLAPQVDHLNRRWRWLLAYLLTDAAYAVSMARLGGGDR